MIIYLLKNIIKNKTQQSYHTDMTDTDNSLRQSQQSVACFFLFFCPFGQAVVTDHTTLFSVCFFLPSYYGFIFIALR